MKIVVYTAIFGEIDPLWPPLPVAMDGTQYICFSDKQRLERGYWTQQLTEDWPSIALGSEKFHAIHQPQWQLRIIKPKLGFRKTARRCKVLVHEYFPDADVTIWLDGNIRLLISAKQAVKRWLGDADFATFTHTDRNCLYREAEFCLEKGKGNKSELRAQIAAYRQAKMPHYWGLPETKCVIRRNTERIKMLNETWWAELEQHSIRDQVSLPYVCWKLGIKWKQIPGRAGLRSFPGKLNPAFWYTKHRFGTQNTERKRNDLS